MSRRTRKMNRAMRQQEENKMEITNSNTAEWSEIRKLPVGVLEIDPSYQRDYRPEWSKEIAANFNPKLLDIIYVSYRDGRFWVFDGQHRVSGVKIKFHDSNYPMVCRVYHGMTQEDEARLFCELNTSTMKMSAAAILKSQAVYGDESVKSFLQHTKDCGFVIDPSKRVNCRYGIQAVKKAQTLFERLGPDTYDRILSLLKATWGGEQWSVSQNMLGGMGALLQTYGDKIDDVKFASQLRNITENQIVKQAGRYSDESVPVAHACALVDYYNKGMRNGKLKRSMLFED